MMKNIYSRMSFILMLAISLSLLVTVSVPAKPALAQSITLSAPGGYLGVKIIVTGDNFDVYKGGSVYLYFGDSRLKSVTVSESGTFTTDFNVPSTATPGERYYISIEDDFNNRLAGRQFLVLKSKMEIEPAEGKVEDWINLNVSHFEANRPVRIYFSSDSAFFGDGIGSKVTTYECMETEFGMVFTNSEGVFDGPYRFKVPTELTHGTHTADVREGKYFIYATYFLGQTGTELIEATAEFTVLNGDITLAPENGEVGTEVQINGEGLRNNQRITVRYDGEIADIVSGTGETDSEGNFNCTIIIPESPAGKHVITAADEVGNRPGAEFSVRPSLTVTPNPAVIGNVVKVSGVGFGEKRYISITFNGNKVTTTPISILINRLGSFSTDFVVPANAVIGTNTIAAEDNSLNAAETQMIVQGAPATPASISLSPNTSVSAPGYVGMELVVNGTDFKADAKVTITYGNGETITVAETTTDTRGDFSAKFDILPGAAGNKVVTATDGTSSVTSVFVLESEAPLMPMLLLPDVASVAGIKAHFDWQDVTDSSSITYTLQIGADENFSNIIFKKEGLPLSEYRITEEDKFEPTDTDNTPFYWRVKAVDGALNESDWTTPRLFYIGSSETSIPAWVQYTLYGLGGLLLVFLGFWVRRLITSR